MTSSTSAVKAVSDAGSIGVYQRLVAGRKPGKVQVFRAVYVSCRGPDGKAYGRTNNNYLLGIASGTERLAAEEETRLRALGLADSEIVYVNGRLAELAGPAREQALTVQLAEALACIDSAVAIGCSISGAQGVVLEKLTEAYIALGGIGGLTKAAREPAPTLEEALCAFETSLESLFRLLEPKWREIRGSGKVPRDGAVREFGRTFIKPVEEKVDAWLTAWQRVGARKKVSRLRPSSQEVVGG